MFLIFAIHLKFKIEENCCMSNHNFLKIALLYTTITKVKWFQITTNMNFLQHQGHILYANQFFGSFELV